ncbi:prepilin peptidase [Agaribacter marinus]|uniref:Prepilin leader peptidase/N-methyltransferase n=1 Tax=Agaribacter marinus TaxID=1431249 RepID=A0AA37SZ75_9ALTE|nr:A24 family peptidase [Agaribacter marinus]GLR71049.1 type 4 prepilin-like proteins leader peptide-processing enzyme [Agaribacter marinus]
MTDIFDLMATSSTAFISITFVVSLLVGSFLNVVIYRLPVMMKRDWEDELFYHQHPDKPLPKRDTFNLVKPDSTCPKCGHKIRAWENIPVISWLFLKAKCSQCDTSISARYPAIELLTAILSAIAAWQLGYTPIGLAFVVGVWLLVAMTFIDLDEMLLPDTLTLSLLWLGLLIHALFLPEALKDAVLGGIFGYLSLFTVYWGFKLITGKEGMGYGDFKLLAALGVWVGWQHLPIIILLSSVVGAIVGITLMLKQNKDGNLAIPFGPYLAAAGYLTVLFGDIIATSYLDMLL